MKFNSWSMRRLREGKKTLTSRRKSHDGDEDVLYIVGPLPWEFIVTYLYRDEGAESPDELQRVIDQIFRRKVHGNEMFYVHVLDVPHILKDGIYSGLQEAV